MAIAAVDVGLQVDPVSPVTRLISSGAHNAADANHPTDPLSPQTWNHWVAIWLTALGVDWSVTQTYELGLLLTDDLGIQRFNRDYRHQDNPTDVLSFPTVDVEGAPEWQPDYPVYLGDIVISVETARRQARDRKHTLVKELVWLATHGLLHLLEWDHPDDEQLEAMLRQQDVLLTAVGFTRLGQFSTDPPNGTHQTAD
ncbi:MAG: rRNA maturation RNase YbeY [Elainellaceae cyanobacterium]